MILESVVENLNAEGLLQAAPRTHLVLGYSGGADSTALLFLLGEIQRRVPLDITAAYYHHRWRGRFPEELPLIHRHCRNAGVPLVIIQADRSVPHTENGARQARYRQLTRLTADLGASALLTAHHADDQIETLLFRILRGTGIDGLSGIQRRLLPEEDFGAPVPVLRPLLDVPRKNIRAYLQERGLDYFSDPTNLDGKRQRNHIRHQILPMLEESYPYVKNSLFRLSLAVEGDLEIIEEATEKTWRSVFGKDQNGRYLDALRFNQLSQAHQRRVLKRFLAGEDIYPDFERIEDLLSFIRGEDRRNLDASLKSLVKGEDGRERFLALYKNRLRLLSVIKPPQDSEVSVSLPGPTALPGLDVSLIARPWRQPSIIKISPIRQQDSQQVYVDLSAFPDKPLTLRTRRPGDRFQPLGMAAPLRFKKFLINRGVPRFQRDRLPVLAHGNQILWAPGLGISQQIKVRDNATPTHLLQLLPGVNHPPLPPEPSEPIEEADREEPIRELPPERTPYLGEEADTIDLDTGESESADSSESSEPVES